MAHSKHNPKRKHHYVWREYLRAWASKEKIFCLMDGKVFHPNIEGVGQKRDFYRMQVLTDADVEFIRKMTIGSDQGLKRKIHEQCIQNYVSASKMIEMSSIFGPENDEISHAGDIIRSNLIEDSHGDVEARGIQYLKMLLDYDASFLNDKEGYINFAVYLVTQFLRTRKARETVLKIPSQINKDMVARTWPIISQMFAINIASSIYNRKSEYYLEIFENSSEVDFITSDQPVVNTLPPEKLPQPHEVEFFYPISPKIAIRFGNKNTVPDLRCKITQACEIEKFNDMMASNAHLQLYAHKETSLSHRIGSFVRT